MTARATPYEAATALVLEARRRDLSYGQLVAAADWWEQDKIIAAYMKEKRARGRARGPGKNAANGDQKMLEGE